MPPPPVLPPVIPPVTPPPAIVAAAVPPAPVQRENPRNRPNPETYSPFPTPIEGAPAVEDLERVRQAALLYVRPTNNDDNQASVHLAQVLAMSLQGASEKVIAESLGITKHQVRVARRALHARKLLEEPLTDAINRLTREAVPLAVDNVIAQLEDGDKKMTERVLDTFGLGPAKGTGVAGGDNPAAPRIPALTINYNLPPGVTIERANVMPPSGKIVGRGKGQPRLVPATDEDRDHAIEMPAATNG